MVLFTRTRGKYPIYLPCWFSEGKNKGLKYYILFCFTYLYRFYLADMYYELLYFSEALAEEKYNLRVIHGGQIKTNIGMENKINFIFYFLTKVKPLHDTTRGCG